MEGDITVKRRDRYLAATILAAWAGVAVVIAASVAPSWPGIIFGNGFASFWTAARIVLAGQPSVLYDPNVQLTWQHTLHSELGLASRETRTGYDPFFYPPPFALVLLPLASMPAPSAYLLWVALNFIFIVVAVTLPLKGMPQGMSRAAILITFPAAAYDLLWGQVSGLLLLVLSLALVSMASGQRTIGGMLLGLLCIKPQCALLFPLVFLLKRRWRELAGFSAVGLSMVGISVVILGPEGVKLYLSHLGHAGGYYHPPDLSHSIKAYHMANWRGLLMNLWPGISEAGGSITVMALGAATVAASLIVWRGKWDPCGPRFPRQVLVLVLATLISIPHSHFYGFTLVLAPLAFALAKPMDRSPLARSWRWILLAGYLLALLIWPLGLLWDGHPLQWLAVPYSLVLMGILIVQCRADLTRESVNPQNTRSGT
ncbi:MAG: glycosyltransferase family 87 protein [Chloroflexota bacterium]